MKRILLFVACINEDFETSLTYIADLARSMEKNIAILILDRTKKMTNRFEKIMTAITFAEANEHDMATEMLERDDSSIAEAAVKSFENKFIERGVEFTIHSSQLDIADAISEVMNKTKGVEMVLLGPSVIDNGNITSSTLKKLVKKVSRPIVTMSRHTEPNAVQRGEDNKEEVSDVFLFANSINKY